MSTGASWNFADLWEDIAVIRGDQRALVHGDRRWSWTEFNEIANGVARAMLDAGLARQDKVAQYLYNCPEYMTSVFACFKASLVPVNTNYRYTDDELLYLWDNSDAAVVVFHAGFTDTIERIRDRLPKVKLWISVADETGAGPGWATPWDSIAPTAENISHPDGRSGADRWFLYTGGTTGMPKGVMWEQDTLVRIGTRTQPVPLDGDEPDLDAWRASIEAMGAAAPVALPGAPLMHGTGHISALNALIQGGAIVTMPNRRLDTEAMLDTIERERVTTVIIVGDAFARPILDSLDTEPDRWDLGSVLLMVSSGAMWSQSVKQRLIDYMPQLTIFDSLGSSEAVGMGASYSTKENVSTTAKFDLGERAVVIRDDGELVQPGSGDIGRLGVQGHMPVGYYKDEVKTAATFPTINGVRYSLPGDFATVEADGTITLLGRGSVCINTGGEKVFPEEVEEVLKTHPDIVDAIAVGVPDERFGQAVVAVVEPVRAATVDTGQVIDHVKDRLAHYKAPRMVFCVDSLTRAPNGKIDYKKWSSYAEEQAAS